MMPIKPIRDWRNVFLDTSFIVDIVSNPSRFDKNPLVQARIQSAHQLLNALDRTAAEIKRTFFISTMTVTELQKLPTTNRVDKALIQMFNAVDVEFVPYSLQSALALNNRFEALLPDSQQSQWRAHVEKVGKAGMLPNTRQWVATDMFIAGAALSVKKLDVILTSDKNTFKLITDALELPCLTMFQADFPKDLFGEIAL